MQTTNVSRHLTGVSRVVLADGQYAERAKGFIKMLPEKDYGEAALTALGVKPVTMYTEKTEIVGHLMRHSQDLHRHGLALMSVMLNGRETLLFINTHSIGLVRTSYPCVPSSLKTISEIFTSSELLKKHGGAFFGYPQESMPAKEGSTVLTWRAYDQETEKFMTHYMWFRWENELRKKDEGKFEVDITDACLTIERMREKINVVDVKASKSEFSRD
jgi:hypothetical protein